MAWAPSIGTLMFGRFVVGLGVGFAAQIVPLYLSEIAPKEIRGKLVAMNICTITIGQVLSVILVFMMKPNWRAMLGLAAIPSTVQFFAMLCMPESPRWLGKAGRHEEMKEVIHLIYTPDYQEAAVKDLDDEVDGLRVETSLSEGQRLRSLFRIYGKCLLIGCSMQAFQQLMGINTAMYYGPDILKDAQIQF